MSHPKGTDTKPQTHPTRAGGIVRAPRPSRQFTTIRNEVLRDKRLSFRALGILVEILSRPDNWRTRSETLAAGRREGRDAVRTALAELKAAGYLEQHKTRDDTGRIATVSVVYDEPRDAPADAPAPENPSPVPGPENPAPGKPSAGKSGGIRTTETNDCVRNESAAAASSSSARADSKDDDDASRRVRKPTPKQRASVDREARTAARKQRERERAIQDICARLGCDLDQAATLCDHLIDEFQPANLYRYVEAIDNDDLETLLDVATEDLAERRQAYRSCAEHHARSIAQFHAGAARGEIGTLTAIFYDALDGGMSEGEMVRRVNAARVPQNARKVANQYAEALGLASATAA